MMTSYKHINKRGDWNHRGRLVLAGVLPLVFAHVLQAFGAHTCSLQVLCVCLRTTLLGEESGSSHFISQQNISAAGSVPNGLEGNGNMEAILSRGWTGWMAWLA